MEAIGVRPRPALDTSHLSRVVAVVLLMALGWGLYSLFTAPMFYVSGVEVRGNAMIGADEIFSASQLHGLSIFWVDTETVRKQIEALPEVKSAQVRAVLPARVIITLEERAPQIAWQSGAATWWIDAEGVVIAPRGALEGRVVVTDVDASPVEAGQVLPTSLLASVNSLRALLPGLSEMLYSREHGIGFRTGEGWPVYVGDGQDLESKLTVLKALRKHLLERGITPAFIDVQYPQRAYYR
jgi:cell division septal protein FtsQ